MGNELIIIEKYEKEIQKRLKVVSFEEIRKTEGSVSINSDDKVIGLNLNHAPLMDIPMNLSEFCSLRKLFLNDTHCDDYSFLKELEYLTELSLSENKVHDISYLKKMVHLEVLDLSGNHISDISTLCDLSRLRTLDITANQVSDTFPLKRMDNLNVLNLGGNQIINISFLQDLGSIKELNLSDNQIKDISPINNLSRLDTLNLNNSSQLNDFSPIRNLQSLHNLSLADSGIKNISFLGAMVQLRSLDLGSNQITDISYLQGLVKLIALHLPNNKIDDISFLGRLNALNTLNLALNHVTDITAIKNLIDLKVLNLNFNKIIDFSPLKGLLNLNSLSLAGNDLGNISFIKSMNNLNTLDLSHNSINELSFLRRFSGLNSLNLSNNQVEDISFIQAMKNLKRLDIRKNSIRELPEEIVSLDMDIVLDDKLISYSEQYIMLSSNPIVKPPIEIITKGKAQIRDYFKSLKTEETRNLNEVKLLLVGDGAVGKTSLVNRLRGKSFDQKEPPTHGINVDDWIVTNNGEELKVHLWDFGGQEIMHATHQFFFSKRSLYILILDGRRDIKIEYWLKLIEILGGNSQVLVVINKIDETPAFEVNRKFYKYKYNNIEGFYRVSCKTLEGIDQFVNALKKALQRVKIIKTPWPSRWFNIKNKLENMEQPFISYQKYQEICSVEEIKEKLTQETLVDFLNDLGVILYFKVLELKDTSVLEPKWVTEAVYRIINSEILAKCKGVLDLNLLEDILKKKSERDYYYPREKHQYIIQLMKEFELCYELYKGHVLIPDLLKVEECEFTFDYQNALKYIFKYDFLPKSVIPRFIVRTHEDAEYNLPWRTGVFLRSKAFHSTAVVKADEYARKIDIFVSGKKRREYFSIIRKTFRDINCSFQKIEVDELLPLPYYERHTVKYEELVGLKRMGVKEFIIGLLNKKYFVQELLDSIECEEERNINNEDVYMQSDAYPKEKNKKIQILHLSDIHINNQNEAIKFRSQLETDLIKELKVNRLDYLIISGDITNHSTPEEYNAAFDLIERIVKRFGLDLSRVVVVPGNHDLNWGLSREAYLFVHKENIHKPLKEGQYIQAGEEGFLVRDEELYKQRFVHFSTKFYKRVYGGQEYPLDYSEQAIIYSIPEDELLFLGLNSCWEVDHKYQDRSSINMNALSHSLQKLQDSKYDHWIKIAVLHYPVFGPNMIKNVEFLEQLSVHGFQICIHGHVHEVGQGFYKYDAERCLHIIGAGTFGAPVKNQVLGIPLQYNLLTLDQKNRIITVETRKKEKPDGAWFADARWVDKKNPKPAYTIELK